jgi:hypothetical protein
LQQRSTYPPVHDAHHALPVRLLERPPSQKTRTRSWPQNATQLAQRSNYIAEEHNPESTRSHVKAVIGKRQTMRVALLEGEIFKSAGLGSTLCDL